MVARLVVVSVIKMSVQCILTVVKDCYMLFPALQFRNNFGLQTWRFGRAGFLNLVSQLSIQNVFERSAIAKL